MFRITEDPSSGSLVQCLAKKLQEWFYSVRWHGQGRCYGSTLWPLCMCVVHCIWRHTHTQRVTICCHNTDLVHDNGHYRIILVIFSQALYKAPLMMEPLWSETCWSTFKYFIILIVSIYGILCIGWTVKCLIDKNHMQMEMRGNAGEMMLTGDHRGIRKDPVPLHCAQHEPRTVPIHLINRHHRPATSNPINFLLLKEEEGSETWRR